MVVNVRDGAAVEQFVSHDVVLLPKLVTVRPPAERPLTEQLPPSSPVAVSDMHQYNNQVVGHHMYIALGTQYTHSVSVSEWTLCVTGALFE